MNFSDALKVMEAGGIVSADKSILSFDYQKRCHFRIRNGDMQYRIIIDPGNHNKRTYEWCSCENDFNSWNINEFLQMEYIDISVPDYLNGTFAGNIRDSLKEKGCDVDNWHDYDLCQVYFTFYYMDCDTKDRMQDMANDIKNGTAYEGVYCAGDFRYRRYMWS